MCKNLFILLCLILSFSSFAAEGTFSPNASVGFRGGKESLNDSPVAYASIKTFLIKQKLDGFSQIHFLGPGLNIQSDGKFAISVSPIAVSTFTGATIGLDYFFKESDVKGGSMGLFIGFTFQ